jgi:hypothetical protein
MTDLYNVDIPDLLSNVPLSLPIQPGSGDDYYVTMEDVRLAMENCLQDHMLNHVVSIYDDVFIIEPAPEE